MSAEGSRHNLAEMAECDMVALGPINLRRPDPSDPRFYFLRPEDAGSKIKVSYRPVRDDGWQGELKTSQSLLVVAS